MKTTFLKSALLFLLITSFTSCNNDDAVAGIIAPPGLPEFLYGEGGATSLTSVTNPIAIASSSEIFGRNGTTDVVKIKIRFLVIGVYEIGGGNEFTYTRVGTTSPWTAISGRIIITAVDRNQITGTFDLTAGNSSLGINSVSGRFSNITVNP